MSLLEKIQNKPQNEKLKIIWTVAGIFLVLMVALWVLTSKIGKNYGGAKGLFHSLSDIFNKEKEGYKKDYQITK